MDIMGVSSSHRDVSDAIQSSKRLVIKIGSALILDEDGTPSHGWIDALASDLSALSRQGADIAIVSSGAVGLGRIQLNLSGPLRLEEKQAAAAAGQPVLMALWRDALRSHGLSAAQVLLTLDDTEHRRRYLNARNTLQTLMELSAIPIVNENDTIATDEIRYGDNDRLAAHVAQMISASALIVLSDIDGLYSHNPMRDPDAVHIPFVAKIDRSIEAMASGPNEMRGTGSGGMVTKIDAAKIATAAGCAAIIARGNVEHPVKKLLEGARSTFFAPDQNPERARRAWIAGRVKPGGTVQIDQGAIAAVLGGASLLPAGAINAIGDFDKGDAIAIEGPDGTLVARGLSAYDSRELKQILGMQSVDIEKKLGYRRAALVHRDDLVLLTS